MASAPPTVAIFNTSPDTIELLRIVLEPAGYIVVGAYTYELRDGEIDVQALVEQHQPKLIIYDVAPPYDRNLRLMKHFAAMPALKGINFLITTTNAKQVRELCGPDTEVYEIVGKPYDLGLIVQAVKDTIGAP
jgi:CheY-like chemotaxis protein